ncbi:MAG TPA: hypothetical protein VHV49_21685 [Pseudonocardiaceae bacterium]|jgi:hypothetical protein|nr:hypothetical protein [Pseudonocardiaceae bacterium]
MSLTARERRVLAEMERQFRPRRRRPARIPTVLAVGWVTCGLLFAALMSGDWILAATAGALGVGLITWQVLQART